MQRKRDGDGDGFVDDGTPLERPWVPGVDLGPVEDAAKAKPKVPGGQQVPADVAVKRGRVGNVDTPRLQRRRERLISEIDDPGQFYKGGRHGFAMRAAELTVIESELVKRGDLKVKDRYTVSIKDKVEVPDWENATELGSSGSGWDGRVYVVPDDTTMDTGGRPYDHWTREVPILPDHLLEWVAEGANLGGLRNRDDNRLDRMKNYARSLLEERQGGGEDDSWGPTHEAIWDRLTKGQDSRQALSRAIHDGPTPEERDFYRLLHEHFLDFAARRWPEHGDVIPVQRMSTEDDPFTSNVGWKKKAEQPKAGSSGFTSWDAMDYDEPYYHELRARRSRSGATTWVGDVPKDQILGRFGDTENELLIAKDPETLQRLIGEPDSPFATTDTPGEVGGAAAPVEMDDTFRKAVNQRGSRVNAEDMQDAWAVAVANPDDIEAIRAALPPIAIDRWQRLHGASPEESLRRGRGGMPSLEGMIAHNARRLTEAVPLTRDNLGVNGMPSSAEIVEHDPAMAKWLGITDRTSFGELRTAIARRPLANLLSDPEPDPQGIRYLKMLRRAAERDVGRRGGAVTLHRANTQGTDTPFDTKGGSGLTSWTTDYATAAKYAKGGVTVASVDVPGDRILAYDTFGIMASTGFYDFAGQDSYPLPGREVIVTSPELLDRLDRDEFPLLPPVRSVLADDGVEMAMAEPIADLKALHGVDRDWRSVRGLPPERRAAVAAAYAELPAVEPTAEVRRSWDAAATEVDQQYERLTGELGVTVEYVDADPYRTFAEMYADFVESRRLKVLRTSATGSHPYWSDETNDRFRAVHDAFGHLATGRGFDRHGEEAAYQAHTSMFSDAALPALVTELRGQNAALIETGEFADQKVGILPADIAAVIAALLTLASSSRLRTADDDNLTAVGGTHHASNGRHFSAKTAAAKRDGDGDGMVDDGTPMERPWNPLTDLKPKRTVYHLTDKARFKLDPKKVPQDNALAINERTAPGLYVAKNAHGVQTWVNGYGYLRPFVVELDVPEEVLADERWGNEGFIPADKFDDVEVKRVIPVDALARETYNDYGWVEGTLGSTFDDGAPVPERKMFEPYEGLPPGYRYEGPDVRDMTPAETKRLAAGARVARKAQGKENWTPASNPFAAPEANPFEPVDTPGELGRAASKYPGMRPVTAEERKGLTVEGRPIPPAWTDVHVAVDPDAAMQARGLDGKGRHQYIYSIEHQQRAAAAKYARTKELATRVPKLDAAIERDAMTDPAAAATALIRHFGLRPGSTSDTKARKKAYGATTLQARHVRQYPETGRTTLSFVGKSGVNITVSTRDPDIYRIVEHWKGDKEGTVDLFPADDADVRAYVTEHLGEGFKAKDLRTLLANVMALDMVSSMRRPTTQAKFKAARNKIADAVAKALGNTRAVTLSNYIDPTVFAAWEGALP